VDDSIIIRDKIIPHAVSWFTGEAIEEDELDGIDYDGNGDDDDDDDDEEEEEEDGVMIGPLRPPEPADSDEEDFLYRIPTSNEIVLGGHSKVTLVMF
jgi:hypothetical protein